MATLQPDLKDIVKEIKNHVDKKLNPDLESLLGRVDSGRANDKT